MSRSTLDPWLVNLVLPFFEAQGWRGPAEVELKFDARDSRHKIIEINPRFPGYLRFACTCGLDLPTLTAATALQPDRTQSRPYPDYRVGATYVAPTLFAQTLCHDVRERGVASAMRTAWGDARSAARSVVALLSDPLPLLARTLAPATTTTANAVDLLGLRAARDPSLEDLACAG